MGLQPFSFRLRPLSLEVQREIAADLGNALPLSVCHVFSMCVPAKVRKAVVSSHAIAVTHFLSRLRGAEKGHENQPASRVCSGPPHSRQADHPVAGRLDVLWQHTPSGGALSPTVRWPATPDLPRVVSSVAVEPWYQPNLGAFGVWKWGQLRFVLHGVASLSTGVSWVLGVIIAYTTLENTYTYLKKYKIVRQCGHLWPAFEESRKSKVCKLFPAPPIVSIPGSKLVNPYILVCARGHTGLTGHKSPQPGATGGLKVWPPLWPVAENLWPHNPAAGARPLIRVTGMHLGGGRNVKMGVQPLRGGRGNYSSGDRGRGGSAAGLGGL